VIRRIAAHLLSLLAAVPAALWIVRHERIIRSRGRPLNDDELAFTRSLGIAAPERVRILALPRIPAPLGGLIAPLENLCGFSLSRSAGVTLGHAIYLAQAEESPALVRHELVHVHQYERLGGPLPFIRRYFYECLVFSYWDAPLEREAVARSRP
jgi:hypothetical protein